MTVTGKYSSLVIRPHRLQRPDLVSISTCSTRMMNFLEQREITQPTEKGIIKHPKVAGPNNIQPKKLARPLQRSQPGPSPKSLPTKIEAMANEMLEDADVSQAFTDAIEAMQDLNLEQQQQTFDLATLLAALPKNVFPLPQEQETLLRRKFLDELSPVLALLVILVHDKDVEDRRIHNERGYTHAFVPDRLARLHVPRLVKAWEAQVWARTYEAAGDVEGYVEQMQLEISDLMIWEKHFESECDGYGMFVQEVEKRFSGDEFYFGPEVELRYTTERVDGRVYTKVSWE